MTARARADSVERFYEQPLIWDVSCDSDKLEFKTVNNFRQNNADKASYWVENLDATSTLASGSFGFRPHWLPTTVSVDLDYEYRGYVHVKNKWGDATKAYFNCGDGDDESDD